LSIFSSKFFNTILNLLELSMEEAEGTIEATKATIIEEKRNFNLS
jgi:hypothetical protein